MKKMNFSRQKGLIPAIIQEDKTGEVLMLGYMNKDALVRTQKTGLVHFWSRSKKRLWMKGETSGNKLKVKNIYTDCDKDTILIVAELVGKNVCHDGYRSCFYKNSYDSR